MRLSFVGLLIAAGIAVTSCAAAPRDEGSSSLRAQSTGAPTPSYSTLPWQPPHIDWDRMDGIRDVVLTPGADPVAVGGLPFTPVKPELGMPIWSVLVSDPAQVPPAGRSVVYVFHFPVGAQFPTDGHVVVREQKADPNEADVFANMAAANADSGQYQLLGINGKPALLLSGHGIGRVLMLDGAVRVDITGPAVSPEEVQALAHLMP